MGVFTMAMLRLLLILLLAAAPVVAQGPTYGVGRTPTAEEVRAWDISISPTGRSSHRGAAPPKTARWSIGASARDVTG